MSSFKNNIYCEQDIYATGNSVLKGLNTFGTIFVSSTSFLNNATIPNLVVTNISAGATYSDTVVANIRAYVAGIDVTNDVTASSIYSAISTIANLVSTNLSTSTLRVAGNSVLSGTVTTGTLRSASISTSAGGGISTQTLSVGPGVSSLSIVTATGVISNFSSASNGSHSLLGNTVLNNTTIMTINALLCTSSSLALTATRASLALNSNMTLGQVIPQTDFFYFATTTGGLAIKNSSKWITRYNMSYITAPAGGTGILVAALALNNGTIIATSESAAIGTATVGTLTAGIALTEITGGQAISVYALFSSGTLARTITLGAASTLLLTHGATKLTNFY